MDAFFIILTACLVSVCCALLGTFLILRQMAMVGDAISHAVLPGIVIAFLFSGSLSSVPVLIGATVMGLICPIVIEWIHKKARLPEDASIGMVFTFLFAVGVILISLFASNSHLDTECVLYGEIAYVPLDVWVTESGLNLGPITIWLMGGTLVLILAFILIGYRGLFLSTFDPEYAVSVGMSVAFWHYSLMAAVSLTTVMSFESVGAILVVAFLIAPAATAYLLTDNLKWMLLFSALIGMVCSISGYYLAVLINGSISGAIATVMGFWFGIAFFFSPKHGYLTKSWRRKQIGKKSALHPS